MSLSIITFTNSTSIIFIGSRASDIIPATIHYLVQMSFTLIFGSAYLIFMTHVILIDTHVLIYKTYSNTVAK